MDEFEKDPNEVKDFAVDWSEYLEGDTIETSTWILPSGVTEDDSTNTTTLATIFLAGGTDGAEYIIVNRIVTAGGRTLEMPLKVTVGDSTTEPAAPTDEELIAAIDAEIAANPGGVTHYKTRDGREVTRMDLIKLLRARGMIEARETRVAGGMFAGVRVGRPT